MTIKDISALTGYSVGTISRALNNQPNVSEKARTTILRVAAENGFQLNANAKQLKQQHSNSILVIVKGTSNELFSSLVESLQANMDSKYPLIVDYMDESENEVLRALQLCVEKKPLGILFLGGNRRNFLADFDKIPMPCVLVTNDAAGLEFTNLSSVSLDNREAAAMAIDHLAALGHRKIALIGGSRTISDTTKLRYEGCLDSFRRHGISFDEEGDYETVRFSFDGGYKAAKNLLEKGRQFTGIFAMSDVMAIGAVRALRDAGLQVPEDVSVVGFDGLAIGEYMTPRLTTVVQPIQELAAKSIHLLLDQIENRVTPRYETVPVTLTKKESTQVIL